MWRSIASRSRQVARNVAAAQNAKVSSPFLTLPQSHLPPRYSTWVLTRPYLYQNPRFLSQFSVKAIDENSVSSGTELSSLDFVENGDAQREKLSPGVDIPEVSDQALECGENGVTDIDGFAIGGVDIADPGDAQMDNFASGDETNDLSEQVGFGEDGNAKMEGLAPDDSEEVYEIDTEKLENVLSLLQSTVDCSLEASLDGMALNLHNEFVVTVLETPHVSGENLIGFFKWARTKPEFKVTARVVGAIVQVICKDLRKRDVYALWDLVKEIGEKDNSVLSVEILNMLIASLSKLGKGKAALEVFNKFGDFGCAPNAETYYFTTEALCRRSIIDWAWSVCEKMLDARTLPDSAQVGKIISWFCKGSKPKEAHLVYLLAKEKNVYLPQSSVNFLVSSLCQKDDTVKLALGMLDDFPEETRKYAIKPFTSVICGLCRTKNVNEAKTLLSKMISEGPPPGNAVFNSIITSYSKAGDMNEAKEMIKLMKSRGLKPDVYTYTVVMSGYANGGQMEEACKVLSEAKKKHAKLSPATYHTLIRGYCKLEEYDKALKLLGEMKKFGVQPNVDEYNKLIQSLCLKSLDWETAEKLLEEMKENGLHLNGITKGLIRAVKELEQEAMENVESSAEA